MRNVVLGLLAATALCSVARADIAVSSNDAHTVMDNGNQVAAKDGRADTVTVIDLKGTPRILGTVEAPGSVVGPPMAVAVAADESFAIVTGATKIEAGAPGGIGPDDKVSVIDLTVSPPKVVQTLPAGAGATTVRISPDGTMALVANRTAGTLSVFTIKDRRLTAAGTVSIDPKSLPSGIAFLPDGKTALLSRYGDHQLNVLRIAGTSVTIDKRPITAGVSPYTLDITADGTMAAVGNMGRGDGDVDTVSLIDLTVTPFRTVQSLSVARSPEGLKWSPDGKFLAIGAQNGTTKPPADGLFNPAGRLIMLALQDKQLHAVAEAPIGKWTQGIVFSRDGKTLLVQEMVERDILVFGWDGKALTAQGKLDVGAGAAAIMTSWK